MLAKKSIKVRQLKEEIAKLYSNLPNSISKKFESGCSLENTDNMDPKAISLMILFLTIHKKHFKDILHNRFKPKNILKLSTSFTIIKLYIKYIKVRDNIELATHKDNFTAS